MASKERVRELRVIILGVCDSEAEFARSIGWTKQKLSKIINRAKEPDVNELNDIAKGLSRSVGDIAEIFLRQASPNGQQEAS